MAHKKYPYQNQSLKPLKGEQWKPIPGYEGLYEISSLGRVKTLGRTYINNLGASVTIMERILRLQINKRKTKTIPHESYTFSVFLCLNGVRRPQAVARLVYYTFVEQFDLKNRHILVSYKDWDGRNIRPDNLFLTSISDIMKTSHAEHRYEARLSKDSKKVSQFRVDGEYIATYDSILDASRQTGIVSNGISKVANGTSRLHKGYIWQFGTSKVLKRKKVVTEKDGGVNQNLLSVINRTVNSKGIPALADLRLQDRKGEIWKSVEGFEGYYEVSNLGRIKALSRVSKGTIQILLPEMIKKITFKPYYNHENNTEGGSLSVNLRKEELRRGFAIAHLVYHTFVRPLGPHERKRIIYFRDNNRFNLSAENLYFPDEFQNG